MRLFLQRLGQQRRLAYSYYYYTQHTSNFFSNIRALQSTPAVLGRFCTWTPDLMLVDNDHAPLDYDKSAVVYSNVVTNEQADLLVQELQTLFKRRRYQEGHWDSAIANYKEIELGEITTLSEIMKDTIENIRKQLCKLHLSLPSSDIKNILNNDIANEGSNDNISEVGNKVEKDDSIEWMPCHAILLHPQGQLKPHVDSVRFSGEIVAGLSLLSPSIMRLKPLKDKDSSCQNDDDTFSNNSSHDIVDSNHLHRITTSDNETDSTRTQASSDTNNDVSNEVAYVDLYLPPKSLYVLSGQTRYTYTHELLQSHAVYRQNTRVVRDTRLSLIFRDARRNFTCS